MANTSRYKKLIQEITAEGHRTAEQIQKELIKKSVLNLVGLGTIYRNLTALVKEGVLMKTHGLGDKILYEVSKPPHGHLFCQYTGMIMDVDISMLSFDGVTIPKGFCLNEIQVTFAGHFESENSPYCEVTGKLLR
ncbi:MAG TPA: transcriptional repressor [Candidatus Absconditabacterales bacterium]|nr:transcriptional repressor [Candidatus Absconditabacterales bacterium]